MNIMQLQGYMNKLSIDYKRLESRVAELQGLVNQKQLMLSAHPSDIRLKTSYTGDLQQIRALKTEMRRIEVKYADATRKVSAMQCREANKMQRKMLRQMR